MRAVETVERIGRWAQRYEDKMLMATVTDVYFSDTVK